MSTPEAVQIADYVAVGYWYCSTHSGLISVGDDACDLVALNAEMVCERHQLLYSAPMPPLWCQQSFRRNLMLTPPHTRPPESQLPAHNDGPEVQGTIRPEANSGGAP